MCPACLANAMLIIVGATSSAGLTGFALGKLFKLSKTKPIRRSLK